MSDQNEFEFTSDTLPRLNYNMKILKDPDTKHLSKLAVETGIQVCNDMALVLSRVLDIIQCYQDEQDLLEIERLVNEVYGILEQRKE